MTVNNYSNVVTLQNLAVIDVRNRNSKTAKYNLDRKSQLSSALWRMIFGYLPVDEHRDILGKDRVHYLRSFRGINHALKDRMQSIYLKQ